MKLVVLPHRLYLAKAQDLSENVRRAPFWVYIQAEGAGTLVVPEEYLPEGLKAEGPFVALAFEGPLPLEMIGVLGRVGSLLAEVGVSIFAYSAFETDYILIRERYQKLAIETLREAGYQVE